MRQYDGTTLPEDVVHTCGFGAPATGYRSLTGLQAPVTLRALSYKIEFLNSLQLFQTPLH